MATSIEPEAPDSPVARQIIGELEAELDPMYPEASRHGYSVDKLISEGVDFFLVRYQANRRVVVASSSTGPSTAS